MSHPDQGSTTSRTRSTTVARYCPLWAPTTPSQFCFWELTRELPSGSPIIGVLSRATRLPSGSPRARSTTVARYCPLWAYHSLTVLFLGTHTRTTRPSSYQCGGRSSGSRVSSQKQNREGMVSPKRTISCYGGGAGQGCGGPRVGM